MGKDWHEYRQRERGRLWEERLRRQAEILRLENPTLGDKLTFGLIWLCLGAFFYALGIGGAINSGERFAAEYGINPLIAFNGYLFAIIIFGFKYETAAYWSLRIGSYAIAGLGVYHLIFQLTPESLELYDHDSSWGTAFYYLFTYLYMRGAGRVFRNQSLRTEGKQIYKTILLMILITLIYLFFALVASWLVI